jgi:hypothetical protein
MFLTYLSSHILKQEKMHMKKRNEDIERAVSETMKLLEMRPLEVHHLFRVRLMQRIEREFAEGSRRAGTHFSNRLDFRLAFMSLLLVVNLGSAYFTIFDGNPQATVTISEMLDNQGDDYSSQEFALYDQTTAVTASTEPVATETGKSQTP